MEKLLPYSSSLSNDDIKKDRKDLKDLVENVIIKWIIDKANQYFRQTYVIVSYYGNKDLAGILVPFWA